jgi:hypothetical protein
MRATTVGPGRVSWRGRKKGLASVPSAPVRSPQEQPLPAPVPPASSVRSGTVAPRQEAALPEPPRPGALGAPATTRSTPAPPHVPEPPRPVALGAPARGQHYPVALVALFLALLLKAHLPLRAAARALVLVSWHLRLGLAVPDWTTGRSWLLRLGYYKLTRPKEHADDWVWFLDHSCQIGSQKCLVVLGLRLRDLPPAGECLRLEHFEPLEILPVTSSTQHDVLAQLQALVAKTGVPRAIVRDDGGDLRGGVGLFGKEYPRTLDIYDSKHKVACLLRHRLEADPRWKAFSVQVGTTRSQVQQTELAHLAPPGQRPKARYMNVAELVRWAKQTLHLVQTKPPAALGGVTAERLEEKLGWLREYEEAVAEWAEMMEVAGVAEEFVRREGLYVGAAADLREVLAGRCLEHASVVEFWEELLEHVAEQTEGIRAGERLPGSTEALESCFGRLKHLEKEQSRSGFTALVLAVGALVGRTSVAEIAAALDKCPLKRIQQWYKTKLGPSVQSQRQTAYAHARRNKNRMNRFPCQP